MMSGLHQILEKYDNFKELYYCIVKKTNTNDSQILTKKIMLIWQAIMYICLDELLLACLQRYLSKEKTI